jgi:hypothetical protein
MALLGWVDLDSDLGPRLVQSTVEICVTFNFKYGHVKLELLKYI